MPGAIGYVTLVVREYDEAIRWFVDVLGFVLVEDRVLSDGKRWVLVSPGDGRSTALLLARAATPEQRAAIGNQAGGRVFLFLHTDDFARDYAAMRERGVRFLEAPRHEPYGTVAVFEDLLRQPVGFAGTPGWSWWPSALTCENRRDDRHAGWSRLKVVWRFAPMGRILLLKSISSRACRLSGIDPA